MKFDISILENAIMRLEESLAFVQSPQAKEDERLFLQFRTAGIKAFEYTYELSWKTMKRFIEVMSPSESETDVLTFDDLLRVAFEYGLIRDVKKWFTYRKERNTASHAYREDKAAEVFAVIPHFLADAIYLRDQLRKKLGDQK